MSFKTRESHWEILLEYMEEHRDFANGRFIGAEGRTITKKMWNELSNKLNSLGFGQKTADKWQKTWSDFKYQIKKKGSLIKLDQNATGGGPPSCAPFNSLELRALNILGGKEFYMGVGSTEVGVTSAGTSFEGKEFYMGVGSTKVGGTCASVSSTPQKAHYVSCVKKTYPLSRTANPKPQLPQPHFDETESHILNYEIEAPTVTVPGPMASTAKKTKVFELDHSYDDCPPKKKTKINNTDKAYEETITILKSIKNSLDDLKSTVAEKLTDIANAINHNRN